MTVSEILEQAKALTPQERKELVILLIDTLEVPQSKPVPKTGAEIAAMLEAMDPIELVDSHIEDPVEWLQEQRRKDADRLKSFREGDA